MASTTNYVPETNQPIYHWASTPEYNQPHDPYGIDPTATQPTNSDIEDYESNDGYWEARIFACCSSPLHLLTAIFFPCASAAYSARGINKFPVAIGIAVGLFFYATVAFVALAAIEGDDQPATTIGGMEFKAWQTGAGWALVNFLGITFMLRGWFREFHGVRGNKFSDCAASFAFSCCTLAQMSKHTAARANQPQADKATLPGYGV